jgi:mycothiol synthase
MKSAEIRPLRDDEVATYVELRNAIDPRTATMAGWVEQQRRNEKTLRIVLAHKGDDVVGVGSAQEEADRRGLDVGWVSFGVVPEHRSKGVGEALYRELSRHLYALGKAACATSSWTDDEATLAFLQNRGFAEVDRFEFVRLELQASESYEAGPPPGVTIVPLAERPGSERELFEVHREAIADLPSTDDLTPEYDSFYSWELAHPSRRFDLSFIALHDDEVIGYAILGALPASDDAENVMTAVKRNWRRRGVASALKAAQLAAARTAGFRGIVTLNDSRNEPMRKLNERLGYTAQPAQLRLRGPLA